MAVIFWLWTQMPLSGFNVRAMIGAMKIIFQLGAIYGIIKVICKVCFKCRHISYIMCTRIQYSQYTVVSTTFTYFHILVSVASGNDLLQAITWTNIDVS